MRLTLDYPPIWLAGFVFLAWLIGRWLPHGPSWQGGFGWVLVGAGFSMMAIAVITMARRRTTVDPHGQPSALVTDGIFGLSRNPIYLADALVLAGFCLLFSAPLVAVLLVPLFAVVIARRFIAAEETRLEAGFPAEFASYRSRTRRWF